ncbi:MAG TPA: RNA polymerase sigma factor RpoD/SigA [Acidobacteriota bacterium]|nr:RNA polymerase sigma factor RpoD/SigA [Acidobacteriota bacterium]
MKKRSPSQYQSKNLKLYLKQISEFSPLDQQEEKRLGRRIQKGDQAALKKLIEANLKFVVSYVKKYKGMGLSMLDLINEGNIGLIEAAKRYDPTKNVKFISYAVWWIRQAIFNALTRNSRIYHIPQKLSDQVSEMKKVRSRLKKDLGRNPTREEVAGAMNINVPDVEDLEILEEKNLSLSDKYYDEEIELGDKIEDEISPSVEYLIIKNAIQEQIREVLEELDEKEAFVLKLRFGLDDNRPKTLQEIGDALHLTRERIRQIEEKAKRKLSKSHTMQQLRGYLN